MRRLKKYFFICFITFLGVFSSKKCLHAAEPAIVVDGDVSDWNLASCYASDDAKVSKWAAVRNDEYLFLYIQQNGGDQWNMPIQDTLIGVSYESQVEEKYNKLRFTYMLTELKNGDYSDVNGGIIAYKPSLENDQYDVEIAIPMDYFPDLSFVLTYCGSSVAFSDIPLCPNEIEQEKPSEPMYSGIVIDGNFFDWEAISKVNGFNDNLQESAMVWDGDYVYLYFKENSSHYIGNIIHATPYDNGNFCIETDNGYKTAVILEMSGEQPTASVDGTRLEVCYSNYMYEIAVPVTVIKGYTKKTAALNLCLLPDDVNAPIYIHQGVVHWNPGIGDIESGDGENENDSEIYEKTTHITYDYDFTDWEDYPHSTIDYSTGGADGADAEGALFSDGDYLYGHVMYFAGIYNDFFAYYELAINEDYSRTLQLSAKIIDNNGNPVDDYNTYGLPEGTYEFHVFGPETVDGGAWTTNYGAIYMKVGAAGKIEAEYRLDQSKIAHFYKVDQTDIKSLNARYIRIGDEWISCAGTSTGPILGIAISILAALTGAGYYTKRKTNRGMAA